jgi:hypothetical protein
MKIVKLSVLIAALTVYTVLYTKFHSKFDKKPLVVFVRLGFGLNRLIE